jgi:trehalose 6-phosphate phosphatase
MTNNDTNLVTVPHLVELLARSPRPLVLGLDVDGTLAPLVSHPTESALLPGVSLALAVLAACPDIHVAVVSGRNWRNLDGQFDFPTDVTIVGSHGLEFGRPGVDLDSAATTKRGAVEAIARELAGSVPGAWVEPKPAGVALHLRDAPLPAAARAITMLRSRLEPLEPLDVLPGNAVVEVAVHRYDKGAALDRLRVDHAAATVCFIGDDATDELGFARLGPDDVAIKVGGGVTRAPHRLATPIEVAELLTALARAATPG